MAGLLCLKRDKYLNQLIKSRDNHQVKVITGLRRSVKSYLMNDIWNIALNKTFHTIRIHLEKDIMKNINFNYILRIRFMRKITFYEFVLCKYLHFTKNAQSYF